MLCLVCNDEIYDGDEIKCKNCKDYLHFSCASFRETAFRKLTHEAKLKFSCSKCKVNVGLTSNTKSKNEDVFVGSNETLSDLTNSVKFMSAKFDDFSKQLKEVLYNIKELKEENNVLKENNIKLNSDIYKLSKRLNLLEQKSMLNHVEIIGVPDLKNENCEKVVENIAAVMGQPVTVIKAFSIRSKIPNKPMKIIAELSSTHQKKTLMESAKKKKVKACSINESWGNGGIFVNNYLTQYNSNLFFKSRMFAKENNFKFVWYNDCKIFIKKSETSKATIIYDETDLSKLNYNT